MSPSFMQVGIPSPTTPPGFDDRVGAATNANGWIYGLFEIGVVAGIVLLVTLPLWGKRLFRPFGVKDEDEDDR